MNPNDNDAFGRMLAGIFEVYNRAAPSAEARAVWWRILRPFSLEAVSQALGTYTRTEPKFPPTPAQVLALLGKGDGDNRPTADEAWAIALTSHDEAATVVWTQETAEAFAAARPVLDLGDEVGARMAFKAAYDRIVAAARRDGRPPEWTVSLGWDVKRRAAALESAVSAGLLPAPSVAALLPPPEPKTEDDKANAAKVRAMLGKVLADAAQLPTAAERRSVAERDRTASLKAEAEAKVRAFVGAQQ